MLNFWLASDASIFYNTLSRLPILFLNLDGLYVNWNHKLFSTKRRKYWNDNTYAMTQYAVVSWHVKWVVKLFNSSNKDTCASTWSWVFKASHNEAEGGENVSARRSMSERSYDHHWMSGGAASFASMIFIYVVLIHPDVVVYGVNRQQSQY